MKTMIDETELARLEALAIESQRRYVPRFVYDACNAVPALVAEVRRLLERVEAWEWFEEVRIYKPWNEHPNWEACGNSSKRGKIFDRAVDEYKLIYKAAREAVHVDRE